eukprot:gene6047-10048_t
MNEEDDYITPIRQRYLDETLLYTKSPIRQLTPSEFQNESLRATRLSLSGLKKQIQDKPEIIQKTKHFQNMIDSKNSTNSSLFDKKYFFNILIIFILILILMINLIDFKSIFSNDVSYLIKNKNSKYVIEMIKNEKINVNEMIDSKENVPIFYGVKYCDIIFISELLKLNANLYYRNKDYNGILHQIRCEKVVKLLFKFNEMKQLLHSTNKNHDDPLIHLLKLYLKNENEQIEKVILFYLKNKSNLKEREEELLNLAFNIYKKYNNSNILIYLLNQTDLNSNLILFKLSNDLTSLKLFSSYLNLNSKNKEGKNLLYFIESMDILNYLIENKIKLTNILDDFNLSPVSYQLFNFCSKFKSTKNEINNEKLKVIRILNEKINLNEFDILLIGKNQ